MKMKSLFRLFKRFKRTKLLTGYELCERSFVRTVIELLERSPEKFSLEEITGRAVSYGSIIIYYTGAILTPIEPAMTGSEKKRVRELVEPILEKYRVAEIESVIKSIMKEL